MPRAYSTSWLFFRPLPSLRRWLPAILLAVGTTFAVSESAGEAYYFKAFHKLYNEGDPIRALFDAQRAVTYFPFVHRTRELAAITHVSLAGLHPDIVLEAIDRALAQDPHSPSLIFHQFMQHIRRDDFFGARASLEHLDRIGRDWPELEEAHRIFAHFYAHP